jgi:putative spermidine/putrescine transport system permease protein
MATQTAPTGVRQPDLRGGSARRAKNAAARAPGERSLAAAPSTWFVCAGTAAFFIFLIGILVSVVVDSFGKGWFSTWLPESFTTSWYTGA